MKSHIKMSTFDLFDVWQAIRHAITNQLKELRYVRVSQQMRTPLDISGTLFEAVRGWVSHSALRKVQEQRHLLQGPRMTLCSQRFTSSHGLPCSHMLKRLEEAGQNLLIEHFHPHWHLKRETTRPRPVLEPRRVASHAQEMRRQAQPESSTRREPSGFEMIKEGKRAPSKCSRCHVVGHTMTSKDCPLRFKKLLVPPADVPGPAPHSGPAPGLITSAVSNAAESALVMRQTTPSYIVPVYSMEASRHMEPLPDAPVVQSSPRIPAPSTTPHLLLMPDCSAGTPPMPMSEEPSFGEMPLQRGIRSPSLPRYDSPQAIYERYVAARNAWYAAQPAGSSKTNQRYRRAMGLPVRYDKKSYDWCLDYKQMSQRCITSTGSREWTREEMMAYLDWSKAEDERVETLVAKELADNPLGNIRRGVQDVWKSVMRDSREQQAIHSHTDSTEECIVVRMP